MASEQGTTYAAFIDDQLKAEQARRASLDERGSRLQQSTSVTAGLLATAIGLLLGTDGELSGFPLWLFVAAIAVLIAAFLCGILATRLFAYEVADTAALNLMLNDPWGDSETTSRNITAWLNVKTVDRLRPANNYKAGCLLVGIGLQAVGVVLGASTVAFVAAGALTGR